MTYLIMGAGLSGRAFARIADQHIYGTTRNEKNFPFLKAAHIQPLLFPDLANPDSMRKLLKEITHLIISIAPDEEGDILLRDKTLFADMPKLQWIGYLSTVGVYSNHQGAWIDENADCKPSLARNKGRLKAENAWQDFAKNHDVPLAILRLAGIYGPGRNAFLKLQQGTAHRIIKAGQVFNRIHTDDIAGALDHFVYHNISGIFNLADDEPAPPQDVITYAAKLMGITPPPETPFDEAHLSPMAKSFYGDNKRITNAKLKSTGYRLKMADYRQALDIMWQNNRWQ